MPRDAQLDRVDAVFSQWARTGRAERMEASHRATAAPALRDAPVAKGAWWLDLGTGNGWAAREAAARGARAVGVDASRDMLAQARDASGPACAFVRASFGSLPFRDGSFEGAWTMEALYYARDLDAALAEAARVLAPGAQVRCVVDRYRENAASHDWDRMLDVPMHLLGEQEWVDAFGRHGFAEPRTQRLRDASADDWHASEGSLLLTATKGRA